MISICIRQFMANQNLIRNKFNKISKLITVNQLKTIRNLKEVINLANTSLPSWVSSLREASPFQL